jgi:hypothetical protein
MPTIYSKKHPDILIQKQTAGTLKRLGTQAVKEVAISTDFCKIPLLMAQQVFLPIKHRILMGP